MRTPIKVLSVINHHPGHFHRTRLIGDNCNRVTWHKAKGGSMALGVGLVGPGTDTDTLRGITRTLTKE